MYSVSTYRYCTGNKLAAVQSLLDGEEDDEVAGWGDDEELDIDEGMMRPIIMSIHIALYTYDFYTCILILCWLYILLFLIIM